MKLENMTIEELETLSYTDLAFLVIKENGKSMNTASVFKKICTLLDISEEEYTSKIGDFYTSLTTDKRFILLDNAEWDLRDNHSVKIVMDDEDEEEEINEDENDNDDLDNSDEELEEDIDAEVDDDDIVDDDDDLDDLAIVDEDEEELAED